MIFYSVTISIEKQLESEWLSWMQQSHIPAVMNTGYFNSYSLRKVLEPSEHERTSTFNIQYSCASIQDYEAYQENAAPELQLEHKKRYGSHFVSSRKLLETIE